MDSIKKDIVAANLELKAIIQDINACSGPLAELHSLNGAGRSKIAELRKHIDLLGTQAKEQADQEALKDVLLYREQLSVSMEAFRKANLKSMLTIDKLSKESLLRPSKEQQQQGLRQRPKKDREELVKASANTTDHLLSISRQLAATAQRSAETLDTLITSSSSVGGTQEELTATASTIGQSSKLLAKYGRREFTDKLLMFVAFSFFLICVVYIVSKRLF